MGQFRSAGPGLHTGAQSFKTRLITKKVPSFLSLFELGFLYTYFQKKNVFNSLESYNYCTVHHAVAKYEIVFFVFHHRVYIYNTAKSPLFLSREITLYYIVRYRWYCQTMTAILTVLPSLKITHPYQPPFPNSQFSISLIPLLYLKEKSSTTIHEMNSF